MGSQRLDRLASQLVREVSEIFQREISDPRITWVTVTRATISPDLHEARIYLNTIETGEKRAQVLEGAKAAEKFIRRELGHRLQLRVTPNLHFFMDEDLEKAERISKILSDLKREGEAK
ncbi:MAG: 30S ribosome-binding factor RbfA [Candidatus Firestonebacteria bacterium]|nr:30S ribosome-binding factor RbfA [Candidatus Firestonebacteria bacterium]